MLNRAIFVDSTISHQEISALLNNNDLLLPAIKRGDIIKLIKNYQDLKQIILIDGLFDQTTSISHKEILWCLSQNVSVVGIASLGALRAYELKDFGVTGYGNIYEKYCSQEIDGDDEVAISYSNYQNKTLALINVRLTFENIGFYSPNLFRRIKEIHFKYRTWENIKNILPLNIYIQLRENYIDYKKKDVVSYFMNKFETICDKRSQFYNNIYFSREIKNYFYKNTIDYLRNNIILFTKSNNPTNNYSNYDEQPDIKQIASGIARYLDIDNRYNIESIMTILIQFNKFHYPINMIKIFSEKIRKETSLLTSESFIDYLIKQNIDFSLTTLILEGLLKLERFFLGYEI